MVTDPIADMLTRVLNASRVGQSETRIPFSSMKKRILELLSKEGFVGNIKESKATHELVVSLKYDGKTPRVSGAERVSKPSRRVYMSSHTLRPVRYGYGLLVLSTPKGIMSDKEARKEHVGGEAILKIW